MTPDLRSFDWILISTSSGKDSQTQMRLIHRLAKEAGVDSGRLVAAHADLGRIEWPGCKELAGLQAQNYDNMRLVVTKRNGGDLLDYVRRRGKWPSPQQRYCTSDFKRGPIDRVMTALTREIHEWEVRTYHRKPRQVRILNCMGMRAQESDSRKKMQPFTFNKRASNSKREVWDWLPIHQMQLEDVWSDIRASGIPHHEAYDHGMPRLSCSLCIYAPPAALMLAGRLRPELLDEYCQVEQETGHTFKRDLSLVQIRQAIRDGEAAGPVKDWSM